MSQVLDLTKAGHSLGEEMEWGTLAEEKDFVKEIIQLLTEFRAELREPSLVGYLYSSTFPGAETQRGAGRLPVLETTGETEKKPHQNESTCAGQDH